MLTKGIELAIGKEKDKSVFGNDKLLGSVAFDHYVPHLSAQHASVLNYGKPTLYNIKHKYKKVEGLGFLPRPMPARNMGAGFYLPDPMTQYSEVRPMTIWTGDMQRETWDVGTYSSANRMGLQPLYSF
eukprot:CAMPEP_0113893722 /NCGR_PEP_ID=MMETSP0780_2-20120614/16268_1 /TAXON_ID=652834 /ORGANISM="Palpitomonas bilix" /LENGTH=127 /DNA_ID=CAMNT_0000884079 /DNA_START=111 /DNA_END=494 /DNA_ORIENTATION=+ /assembly_acc=CAM_ASM_000599